MLNRRELGKGALLGLAAIMATAGCATATTDVTEQEALAALDPWADALYSGDPARVAEVLAPEYMIVRSDGTGYGKDDYLEVLPKQAIRSQFDNIVAQRHGDLMVLRYTISTNQTILGQAVEAVSPRLSVFRKDGDRWLMVAHASFAKLG